MKTLYVCNNHEKEKSDLIIMEKGKPFISEGIKGVNIDIVELEVY